MSRLFCALKVFPRSSAARVLMRARPAPCRATSLTWLHSGWTQCVAPIGEVIAVPPKLAGTRLEGRLRRRPTRHLLDQKLSDAARPFLLREVGIEIAAFLVCELLQIGRLCLAHPAFSRRFCRPRCRGLPRASRRRRPRGVALAAIQELVDPPRRGRLAQARVEILAGVR